MSSAFADPSPLAAYGWDEVLEEQFTSHRAAGLVPARVAAVDRGLCDVVTEDGPARASTGAASPDPLAAPCTGDWAALRPDGPDGRPAVAALLPRRTAIVRASASRDSRGQVLAANVDTVAIVVPPAARPAPGRIERLVALAWESGARPVVVLTKADRSPAIAAAEAGAAAAAPGVEVVACSAVTGDGVDAVRAVLSGTVVLVGPSGAGKSTLGNALLGAQVLATGAVRDSDGKGRHTTVRRELLPLPGGGVLIDTPGLRAVGLVEASEGLERAFADIAELSAGCRFGDCAHVSEPGCAVLAAVEDGTLPARRLDGYRRLLRESEWAASRTDARLRAEREDRWKSIRKAQRRMYRERGRDR
ncbi:ribosome small subunit-dependent GTPase A [Actinomadura bangladeshensis]|uniref:Small ribosomal subunit biogenesis GTPase RsgA n=1 Tax=Actinomadura bangladeshensis TaxID=453573 RepID=A0A4R4NEC2_9ACTN|nr:ribosome small subunit-dependent GTPase A [Actinomadura bangladeshensis]TDC05547.1 ribosome small subunit-dependent GTPase A [Actinomadura bangladeshensis]